MNVYNSRNYRQQQTPASRSNPRRDDVLVGPKRGSRKEHLEDAATVSSSSSISSHSTNSTLSTSKGRHASSKSKPESKVETIKIDCTKQIKAVDINYQIVSAAVSSWEKKILKIPKWDRKTGESFLRHIFRLAPETILLFGFPEETQYDDPKLSDNERFMTKGSRLIKAIDMAAGFLGPDLEPFETQLYELGWRHIAMQAQPEYWPFVGEALLSVFDDCMIGGITKEERDSWIIIYNFMSYHMIQGLKAHYKVLAEKHKKEEEEVKDKNVKFEGDALVLARETSYRHDLQCAKKVPLSVITYKLVEVVVSSWQSILKIPNWSHVVGDMFLRYIFKLEPATIAIFGFPPETDYRDPNLTKDVTFITKGVVLIRAIDTAVQLLGPDVAPLEGVLFDLGKRHIHMKAQPEHWPIVGEALFLVFEEFMEGGFSGKARESWTLMYNFLGYHMIRGLRYQYKVMEKNKE